MLGFGRKDDDKKEEAAEKAEQEKLSQAMRQMSDQIAAMQKTINERDATIADLRKQLGTSQADDKADDAKVAELQRQLAAAQADDKADEAQVRALTAQVAQAKAASAKASSGPSAAAKVAAADSSLHVGGAAWVRKAGGKELRRRSAPGTSSNILDGLAPGTMLALLGGPESADGHSWWEIITEDNRKGWVAGDELVTKPE
jgi:TolA-binding protein